VDTLKKLAVEICEGRMTFSSWAGGTTFPIALEGALKLKEISYIHAEGYSACGNEGTGPNRVDR